MTTSAVLRRSLCSVCRSRVALAFLLAFCVEPARCSPLKPRGVFLGSVGFLELLHSGLGSYFRMTHLGLAELLRRSGFDEIRIWPFNDVFGNVVRVW